MDIFQPPYSPFDQVGGYAFRFACDEKLLGLFVGKCSYHDDSVICHVTVVKRIFLINIWAEVEPRQVIDTAKICLENVSETTEILVFLGIFSRFFNVVLRPEPRPA